MGQKALAQVLRRLPKPSDPRLLVGSSTADDAGVYRLDATRALVQTIDFFTPIVDDPASYGQIAAANSLSDVYAMGGRPLTALNVLGIPDEGVPPKVVNRILRGGAAKVKEADCLLVGGHTIKNPEPIYGLSVTGLVHPRRLITNAGARPGDRLILTKPLGTGIVTTAIKRDLCPLSLAQRTVRIMRTLNSVGAELGERGLVRGGTDVTGFGLLGHLAALCLASETGAVLSASQLPAIHPTVRSLIDQGCAPGGTKQNLAAANELTEWDRDVAERDRLLMADAQTSGGLLLCVAPRRLQATLETLRRHRTYVSAVVGEITRSRQPRIRVVA